MATQPRDAFGEGTQPVKKQPTGGATAPWPLNGKTLHPEASPGADKARDVIGGPGTFGKEQTPRKPTFEDGFRRRNLGRR